MISRRRYYDIFSHFYDFVIKLHSGDESGIARTLLYEKLDVTGGPVLDLCTGTGAVAIEISKNLGKEMVVGVDFSKGMLKKAKSKKERVPELLHLHFVAADASLLPFKDATFSGCSCSHAFYELKGDKKFKSLLEVRRVLKNGAKFCMMEHEVPKNRFVKLLFYVRLTLLGKREAKIFLEKEIEIFKGLFRNVKKEVSFSGKSKIICGER